MYDLGLSSEQFWSLTFGQFYKLQDRHELLRYYRRSDIASLHATLINCHSPKGRRYRAEDLIGPLPPMSDGLDRRLGLAKIKAKLREIFPGRKGEIGARGKKRVERHLERRG